jgi:two-component system response regulator YcbB
VGITNLAGMCNEYSENEILLEYANALFEYQNVYIEIQKMRHEDVPNGQISLQHFFDGLLQESHGKLSI